MALKGGFMNSKEECLRKADEQDAQGAKDGINVQFVFRD